VKSSPPFLIERPILHPIIQEDICDILSNPLPWQKFESKTILITGASGFLPAYMVECLLALEKQLSIRCKVVGLVRNLAKAKARFKHHIENKFLELIEADVSRPLPYLPRANFIIHAASQASPKFYGSDPVGTMTANIIGVAQLLERSVSWNVDDFLFFSSSEVYGQVSPDKIPTSESDYGFINISESRSCYAESKRAAETLGISYAKQFNVPFKSIRPFHTYGPGMALDDGRVFADLVRNVINRESRILHSEGTAVRAFCYLSDAVSGFFHVLLKGKQSNAYNVGNPNGALSIKELANLLSNLRTDHSPLPVEYHPSARNREYLASPISINSPNVEKLKTLGWSPKYSPADGFSRTLNFFLK